MIALYLGAFVSIALTLLALVALFVGGNADDRDEHARRDMRERLGVGRGVDQFHEGS